MTTPWPGWSEAFDASTPDEAIKHLEELARVSFGAGATVTGPAGNLNRLIGLCIGLAAVELRRLHRLGMLR